MDNNKEFEEAIEDAKRIARLGTPYEQNSFVQWASMAIAFNSSQSHDKEARQALATAKELYMTYLKELSAAQQSGTQPTPREREEMALARFEQATEGTFDGFVFAETFHEKYNKEDALETLEPEHSEVTTSSGVKISVGEIFNRTAYIMTAAARDGKSKKIVEFNRSVYVF